MLIRKLACQHCLEDDFCADEQKGFDEVSRCLNAS